MWPECVRQEKGGEVALGSWNSGRIPPPVLTNAAELGEGGGPLLVKGNLRAYLWSAEE